MKLRNEVLALDLLPPAIGYLSRATVRAVMDGDLRRGRDTDGIVDLDLLKRAFEDTKNDTE
jgi:hypothetical protein